VPDAPFGDEPPQEMGLDIGKGQALADPVVEVGGQAPTLPLLGQGELGSQLFKLLLIGGKAFSARMRSVISSPMLMTR